MVLVTNRPLKESDVYSFAMTSFEVCSSAVNYPTIQYDHLTVNRSSQGSCHMVAVIKARWLLILDVVNDHPAHGTQARIDGCKALFGI
jgi:hypothetical protein